MPTGVEVVEGVEDDREAGKEGDVKRFDIGMMGHEVDQRVKPLGGIAGHDGLGLFDVLVAEEELSVEVGEVDGVEVDDVYFAEAALDESLEQFAADAAGADEENAGLERECISKTSVYTELDER